MSADHLELDVSSGAPDDRTADDDALLLAGLERAVAKARHSFSDDDAAGSLGALSTGLAPEPAPPVDTSAVMEVLREAIDRYAGTEQGEWIGAPPPHLDTAEHPLRAYRRDRRRMFAGIVVLLFLLGGAAYASVGGSSRSKVKTAPASGSGVSVTTAARQVSTSVAPLSLPEDTAAPSSPATTPATHVTPTTHKAATTTTTESTTTAPPDCNADPNASGCPPPPDCNADPNASGCPPPPDCNADPNASGCPPPADCAIDPLPGCTPAQGATENWP